MSHLIPTIASTEPEHGPNIDLLGTSPKASLGQYTSWQEAVPWERVGRGGSFQICCCLCGLRSRETELLVSLEWGLRLEAVAAMLTEGTSRAGLWRLVSQAWGASECGPGSGWYEAGHLALGAGLGIGCLVHFMIQGDSSELLMARGDVVLSPASSWPFNSFLFFLMSFRFNSG